LLLKKADMKPNFILPRVFKKIGWMLFIPGILFGIMYLILKDELHFLDLPVFAIANDEILNKTVFFSIIKNNVFDEIIGLLLIAGGLFIAFSKEKTEDEFIAKIRLESLVWATYVNYSVLILSVIFVYGMTFFWILVFNMFTLLLFFIIRFNWALQKSKNLISDEK